MLSDVTFLLLVYQKFLKPNMSTCFTLKITYVFMTFLLVQLKTNIEILLSFVDNSATYFSGLLQKHVKCCYSLHMQCTKQQFWQHGMKLCVQDDSLHCSNMLHLVTARQFRMKVLIKSPDATYTIYWISGYKEIRIGVLQGHSFNNIAVLLAGAPLRWKWLIYN